MNRNEFLDLARNQLQTVQYAVEVGVWQGDYSHTMVSKLQPQKFYGVDPYLCIEGYNDAPDAAVFANQTNLDKLHATVAARYSNWPNATLLRLTGTDAASLFDTAQLDLVYIDSDHSYNAVSAEISAWWAKVRNGGILCGHDYCEGNPQKGHKYGVIAAVTEFATQYNLEVKTTNEQYATWWVTK